MRDSNVAFRGQISHWHCRTGLTEFCLQDIPSSLNHLNNVVAEPKKEVIWERKLTHY